MVGSKTIIGCYNRKYKQWLKLNSRHILNKEFVNIGNEGYGSRGQQIDLFLKSTFGMNAELQLRFNITSPSFLQCNNIKLQNNTWRIIILTSSVIHMYIILFSQM
jgi:hypothetical protein